MATTLTTLLGLSKPGTADTGWQLIINATLDLIDSFIGKARGPVQCRVVSIANITVASALTNGSTIDGVVVATGDYVLLTAQTAGAENGVYAVVASGAASRVTECNTAAKMPPGLEFNVSEGTLWNMSKWKLKTTGITLGTTVLSIKAQSGRGTFSPTDGSAAGLVFTSPLGDWVLSDELMTVMGSFTVPVTASGLTFIIAGFPVAAKNNLVIGYLGNIMFSGGGGTPGGTAPINCIVVKNTKTMSAFYAGGSAMTNADVSTYPVQFTASYPII